MLERILEEIDDHAIEFESFGMCDDYVSVGWVKEIIRSHMNDVPEEGWIPVSKRLPEERDSIFAKLKNADKLSNIMFAKESDKVNITYEFEDGTRKTGTSYTVDGVWEIEQKYRAKKRKVIAWQPLPEAYREEE